MLEVFTKLGHLCMGSKAAFWVFAVVLIMLGISTYLDLEAKLLFGHVRYFSLSNTHLFSLFLLRNCSLCPISNSPSNNQHLLGAFD